MKFKLMFYISTFGLLFINCNLNKKPIEERFFIPEGYRGYCAVFFGNNYEPIKDTADVRNFYFDTSGILFSKLEFKSGTANTNFFIKRDNGYTQLFGRTFEKNTTNKLTIYTKRVHTLTMNNRNENDVYIYVFYVGNPHNEDGKEEFFFDKKIEKLAEEHYFKKLPPRYP